MTTQFILLNTELLEKEININKEIIDTEIY